MAEVEQKIIEELIVAAGDTALRWIKWKQHHDYNSLMMKCCEDSAHLFDSLEHLVTELQRAGVIVMKKGGEND